MTRRKGTQRRPRAGPKRPPEFIKSPFIELATHHPETIERALSPRVEVQWRKVGKNRESDWNNASKKLPVQHEKLQLRLRFRTGKEPVKGKIPLSKLSILGNGEGTEIRAAFQVRNFSVELPKKKYEFCLFWGIGPL